MCRQHPSSTLTDTLFPSTTLFRAPPNLATDDRTIRARARLGFAAVLEGAPPPQALEAAIAANPDDLEARHLLGVHHIVAGHAEARLAQFTEMLCSRREFEDGRRKQALRGALRVGEDRGGRAARVERGGRAGSLSRCRGSIEKKNRHKR